MAVNNMNTGRDLSVTLYTSIGELRLKNITEYTVKPVIKDITSTNISGVTNHGVHPDRLGTRFQGGPLGRNAGPVFRPVGGGLLRGGEHSRRHVQRVHPATPTTASPSSGTRT